MNRMKVLTGIVQLLLIHYCDMVMGGLIPLNLAGQICTNLSDCKTNNSIVKDNIKRQINVLNSSANHVFHIYAKKQGFHLDSNQSACDADYKDFPKYNLNTTSEKDKMITFYKVFSYLSAAIGNITVQQKTLNSQSKILLHNLTQMHSTINALISNLSCLLCKSYNVTEVDVYYGDTPPTRPYQQKVTGCKILAAYKKFISEAVTPHHSLWNHILPSA
ncbi:leukemia inhibitory factor [Discoglossus pictus]